MKRSFFVVLLLMLSYNSLFAQNLALRADLGLGISGLYDLKTFQKEVYLSKISTYPDVRMLYDFAEKPRFGLGVDLYFNEKNVMGFGCAFRTSDAQILADQAGEGYKMSLKLSGTNIGGLYRHDYLVTNKSRLGAQIDLGMMVAQLKINETQKSNYITRAIDAYDLRSISYYVTPSIQFSQQMGGSGRFYVGLGYEFDREGLLFDRLKDRRLKFMNNHSVTMDWSGFQLTSGLTLDFFSGW